LTSLAFGIVSAITADFYVGRRVRGLLVKLGFLNAVQCTSYIML
jgi:hypothetical protein